MTKEELIEKINSVRDPYSEVKTVYEVLDGLGIKYKRTSCRSCRVDLYNIAREELGLIGSAAEHSGFDNVPANTRYEFTGRAIRWNGKVYDRLSSQEDLQKLHDVFGAAYVREV